MQEGKERATLCNGILFGMLFKRPWHSNKRRRRHMLISFKIDLSFYLYTVFVQVYIELLFLVQQ